jgi:hypothetical protein
MAGSRFSGRQITSMVIATCAAVILMPVSVIAATTGVVNLADPTHPTHRAHVTAGGGLQVTARDASTGSLGRVDNGALRVGGTVKTVPAGSQTVDGTVNVGNLPSSQTVNGTVNVGNLPSNQTVNGTVNVANLPSTQTVAGSVTSIPGLPGTPYARTVSQGFTVPAGQHLVVETISVIATVTSGANVYVEVHYVTGGQAAYIAVPTAFQQTQSGLAYYVATVNVRLYADPNTQIYAASSSPNGTAGVPTLGVVGYLV